MAGFGRSRRTLCLPPGCRRRLPSCPLLRTAGAQAEISSSADTVPALPCRSPSQARGGRVIRLGRSNLRQRLLTDQPEPARPWTSALPISLLTTFLNWSPLTLEGPLTSVCHRQLRVFIQMRFTSQRLALCLPKSEDRCEAAIARGSAKGVLQSLVAARAGT